MPHLEFTILVNQNWNSILSSVIPSPYTCIYVYHMKIDKQPLLEAVLRTTALNRQICIIVSCCTQFNSKSHFVLLKQTEQKIQVKWQMKVIDVMPCYSWRWCQIRNLSFQSFKWKWWFIKNYFQLKAAISKCKKWKGIKLNCVIQCSKKKSYHYHLLLISNKAWKIITVSVI